jgi:hypothetical protein
VALRVRYRPGTFASALKLVCEAGRPYRTLAFPAEESSDVEGDGEEN